jgi:hypothetical protein
MACDIGYLIKDHIPAIMQVLTFELREYNMQLITTKCLNTAVMMMYLLLGADALRTTRYCDVHNVRGRFKKGSDPPGPSIASSLKQAVLGGTRRSLIYVMITDGRMERDPDAVPDAGSSPRPAKKHVYFPGHVFVIERLPRGTYNLYQSYINHYDLFGHIERQSSLSMGRSRMTEVVDGLEKMLNKRAWDRETSDMWVKLTNVPDSHARQFEGYVIQDNLLPCFHEVFTDNCIEKLRDLVDRTLEQLSKKPPSSLDDVYGEEDMFDADAKPLTNRQIIDNLEVLKGKMA